MHATFPGVYLRQVKVLREILVITCSPLITGYRNNEMVSDSRICE